MKNLPVEVRNEKALIRGQLIIRMKVFIIVYLAPKTSVQ